MSTEATPAPQPTPEEPRHKRLIWPWVVAVIAVVVIVAAVAIPLSISAAQQEAEKQAAATAAEEAAEAEEKRLDTFRAALSRCGVDESPDAHVDILDGGESVELLRVTKYDGIPYNTLECILTHLEAPESISAQIGQTRALDGRQSESWDGYEADWTYHPDDGASVLITHAD
jgi:hypothetical protein